MRDEADLTFSMADIGEIAGNDTSIVRRRLGRAARFTQGQSIVTCLRTFPEPPINPLLEMFMGDLARLYTPAEASAVRGLEAAETLVVRDRGIMGGEPVFKGTRIPVHGIAAMLEAGAAEDEMLAGYPSLDRRALKLARIWAAAHPRRGRPKSLADLGLTLKSSRRVALKPAPLGVAFRKASLVAE